jgi:hypothetical protein
MQNDLSSREVPLFSTCGFLDSWFWWWLWWWLGWGIKSISRHLVPPYVAWFTDIGKNDLCRGWIIKSNSGCTMWCFHSIRSPKFSERWVQKQLVQLCSCVPNFVMDHYEPFLVCHKSILSINFPLFAYQRLIPRDHLWKSSPCDCSTRRSFLPHYDFVI